MTAESCSPCRRRCLCGRHGNPDDSTSPSCFDFGYAIWRSTRAKQSRRPDSYALPAANLRFARMLPVFLMLSLFGIVTGCRTTDPRTPEGVVKSVLKVKLTGKEVAVDFYLPRGLKKAPVVVVAHGFSRSRLNMAGWGGLLASNGFIVAIPDLPAWSDHERNGLAIRELLECINSKTLVTEPVPNGDGALIGFSMGGLCTLLAAATNDQVRCWVGLDPVDSGQKGAEAAKRLRIPCAVIQAEPSSCNAHGNATQMAASLTGPLFALRVRGATHTDPEQPTDWLAELVCGKADPDRHAIFERYTIAVLKSVFFGDAPSMATLTATSNDAGVEVLSVRAIKDFKP